MAITVNGTPDTYSPVYNPVGFNVSTNNSAQANFEFVADIYINSAVTMTRRLKFPPYPSQNYGYVDIAGVLKDYLTSNPYTSSESGFAKNTNSILRYDVKFGESYGPSSGITVYPNLTTSGGYAFNGSLEHINLGIQTTISDYVAWNSSNYVQASSAIKFLTNSPRTVNIKDTEGYALYFLNNSSGKAYDRHIRYFNSAGTLLGTSTTVNTASSGVTTYDTRLLRVAVGPSNGLSLPGSTSYYTVYLRDASGNTSSETFRFDIDTNCSKAVNNYRFIFLNRMGGFDSFTFNGQYTRNVEIKKDYYKRLGATWDGGSPAQFLYQATDRAERQYNTSSQDTFTCWSGWITQAESVWLSELFDSPEVYIYKPGGTDNIPVNIVDTNYEYKTTSRDGLFNVEMKFKPTFNKVRQQF